MKLQPITAGPPHYSLRCCACDRTSFSDRGDGWHFDRAGRPWLAYYCPACVARIEHVGEPALVRPPAVDASPDWLHTCPACGDSDPWLFQEVQTRCTWQRMRLSLDRTTGTVEAVDWGSFDYGDDAEPVHVECTSCYTDWPDLDALRRAITAAHGLALACTAGLLATDQKEAPAHA